MSWKNSYLKNAHLAYLNAERHIELGEIDKAKFWLDAVDVYRKLADECKT